MAETTRLNAIRAVTGWNTTDHQPDIKNKNIREYFGCNVFSDQVLQAKLPENIYKSLQKTIKKGQPLDPTVADVVANAMKEWA